MVQHREIPKQPQCPALDAADEETLTHLCFGQTAVDAADLIFVFGNNVQHDQQAKLTAALCQQHPEAPLVLTGGAPNYSDSLGGNNMAVSESDALHRSLVQVAELGSRQVFIERESRNSLENVAFAANYIRSIGPSKMVYLSQSFALGRSAMTIRAVLPEITVLGSMGMDRYVEGELLTSATWTESSKLREIVWGEFLRIVTYSARGDIDAGPHTSIIASLAAKYLL
jgi:uncharacterized SAM-binding protein YcdF (DUF218 family)